MTMLIVSHSKNEHADLIEASCKNVSTPYVRVDTDKISMEIPEVLCSAPGCDTTETKSFDSVFIHQGVFRSGYMKGCDELDASLSRASWENWLDWLEYSVGEETRWVNRPSSIRNSGPIGNQFTLATTAGLTVPATIFTNLKKEVIKFSNEHGEIILKPGNLAGLHMSGKRILAHKIDPRFIDASTLKKSPCLFQQYIEKEHELRVHVIGEKVLTCRIESQLSEKTKVDWRNYSIANTPHYPHILGSAVSSACIEITKKMGLGLGIIDLIVTPQGDHVFLEINSQGHWKWIEQLTELPITQAVMNYLRMVPCPEPL